MPRILVDPEVCKSCELCLAACPRHIIRMSQSLNSKGYHYAEQFNPEDCTGCKLCAIMCPDVAIKVYK